MQRQASRLIGYFPELFNILVAVEVLVVKDARAGDHSNSEDRPLFSTRDTAEHFKCRI